MKYIGLQSQIWRNNFKSSFLLIAFPALLLGLVWLFFYIQYYLDVNEEFPFERVQSQFLTAIPFVLAVVGIWFFIAWFSHSSMILSATASQPLMRNENMRVYNLVENLCMTKGMKTPKIYIIDDDSLNAFASGLSPSTYAISLSKGIIDKLDDEELQAVIAHELTHIRNKDVRLLIISIIFVGIFAFISEMAFRSLRYGRLGKGKKGGQLLLIILLLGVIGYVLSIVFRFSLSRKREYLADAGAVEMTKNSLALSSALKKVSQDPWIEAVEREDVAQMFIEHPTREKKSAANLLNSLFATHPPIEKRIQLLEQF